MRSSRSLLALAAVASAYPSTAPSCRHRVAAVLEGTRPLASDLDGVRALVADCPRWEMVLEAVVWEFVGPPTWPFDDASNGTSYDPSWTYDHPRPRWYYEEEGTGAARGNTTADGTPWSYSYGGWAKGSGSIDRT